MADQSSSVEKQKPRELPLVADCSKTVNHSFPILSDSIQSLLKRKKMTRFFKKVFVFVLIKPLVDIWHLVSGYGLNCVG